MKKSEMVIALATAYAKEIRISRVNRQLGHEEMAENCRYEAEGILTAAVALGLTEKEIIEEYRKMRKSDREGVSK